MRDTCSMRYTDLRIYYSIDAHQISDLGFGTEMIKDIPYLAIQLTQSQEEHPILRKKRSVMGLFTAQQQKMKTLKDVRKEMLSQNQPLFFVKVSGWTM